MDKLPYTKGTALLRPNGKQEKEDAEILPIERLKGVYPNKSLIDPITLVRFINPIAPSKDYSKLSLKERTILFEYYIFPFTVSILSLNTGMRNSVVARLKILIFYLAKKKQILIAEKLTVFCILNLLIK